MTPETVRQYQKEERANIASRIRYSGQQIWDLLKYMVRSELSKPEYVQELKEELSLHYKDERFIQCQNMGGIVSVSLDILLENN